VLTLNLPDLGSWGPSARLVHTRRNRGPDPDRCSLPGWQALHARAGNPTIPDPWATNEEDDPMHSLAVNTWRVDIRADDVCSWFHHEASCRAVQRNHPATHSQHRPQ
jgi:hypothetical protein